MLKEAKNREGSHLPLTEMETSQLLVSTSLLVLPEVTQRRMVAVRKAGAEFRVEGGHWGWFYRTSCSARLSCCFILLEDRTAALLGVGLVLLSLPFALLGLTELLSSCCSALPSWFDDTYGSSFADQPGFSDLDSLCEHFIDDLTAKVRIPREARNANSRQSLHYRYCSNEVVIRDIEPVKLLV
ncbi:hypothetical protein U1Q18_026558 [Sarracenia purpurea var. burkii]